MLRSDSLLPLLSYLLKSFGCMKIVYGSNSWPQELEGGVWEKSGPLIRLVTMESATYAVPKEAFHDQISLDADHSEMVKYDLPSEERYIAVLMRLKECVQRVPEFVGAGPKGVILAECNLNQVE
jgi:hypothetical protein